MFAQNIHICVSAIEIRIVHRSWKLREQAKINLGSARAHSQNPQITNPNPNPSCSKLTLVMPSQEEEMFRTESSLVSSLHDTMAPGSSRTAVGCLAAPGRKNRVRRGRGRGESVRRELDRSSFYPCGEAVAAATPLDGVSSRP